MAEVLMKRIHNQETGEIIDAPLTKAELAEIEELKKQFAPIES